MADVIDGQLEQVRQRLLKGIAESDDLQVQVKAWLYTSGGNSRRIHVNGYDRMTEGEPAPYPRAQLAISDRVKEELEAAKKLGKLVEKLRDGTLKEQLQEAKAALSEGVRKLADHLEKNVLEQKLTRLRDAIDESKDEAIQPVRQEIQALLDLVSGLKALALDVGDLEDITVLVTRITEVQEAVSSVVTVLRDLPAKLAQLLEDLKKLTAAELKSAADEARGAVQKSIDQLKNDGDIKPVLDSLTELREALGLTRKVVTSAGEVAEIPRAVGGDLPLDTSVNLLRSGKREHSDLLVIEIEVRRKQPDGEYEVVTSSYRRIRLRVWGGRFAARGALLFVDPRGSVPGNQSWEPVPTISYVAHIGLKDSDFWNDVLDPGLALSLSLLDFEDDSDFELGAALSVTLFKDFLWFGYGRDIQAEVNYLHVGINPLLLGDIWNQGGVSASSDR